MISVLVLSARTAGWRRAWYPELYWFAGASFEQRSRCFA